MIIHPRLLGNQQIKPVRVSITEWSMQIDFLELTLLRVVDVLVDLVLFILNVANSPLLI